MSEVLQPFFEVNSLSNNALVQILLYGDEKLSNDINKSILKLTLTFVYQTGRFDKHNLIKPIALRHATTKPSYIL